MGEIFILALSEQMALHHDATAKETVVGVERPQRERVAGVDRARDEREPSIEQLLLDLARNEPFVRRVDHTAYAITTFSEGPSEFCSGVQSAAGHCSDNQERLDARCHRGRQRRV